VKNSSKERSGGRERSGAQKRSQARSVLERWRECI
jgi:hypothetical protein